MRRQASKAADARLAKEISGLSPEAIEFVTYAITSGELGTISKLSQPEIHARFQEWRRTERATGGTQ